MFLCAESNKIFKTSKTKRPRLSRISSCESSSIRRRFDSRRDVQLFIRTRLKKGGKEEEKESHEEDSSREHETFASINDAELPPRFLPSRNNWLLPGRFRIVLGLDSRARFEDVSWGRSCETAVNRGDALEYSCRVRGSDRIRIEIDIVAEYLII